MKKETLQQRAEAAASKKKELMNSLNSELAKMTKKKADLETKLGDTEISLTEVQAAATELAGTEKYIEVLNRRIIASSKASEEEKANLKMFIADAIAEFSKTQEEVWNYFHSVSLDIAKKGDLYMSEKKRINQLVIDYCRAIDINESPETIKAKYNIGALGEWGCPALINNYRIDSALFLKKETDPITGNPFLKK